ncbi:MAG: sigma-70 family RNA polymerase sigma factor [Methanobrevibacter sp.]|nr:sigma-70 family RNA polymerase sigma factor [Methanobrevibacter sp.]
MREEKILNNIGLIHKVMKDLNYHYRGDDDFDEVFYYGLLGLINGIDTLNEAKGNSSYLYTCIKNKIMQLFVIRSAQMRKGETISMELYLGTSEFPIKEIIADTTNIEEEYIHKEEIENMLATLERFKNKKHIAIIKENFGIGCEKKSIREISKKYGVSPQAIQQMRVRLLKWLKKELENE